MIIMTARIFAKKQNNKIRKRVCSGKIWNVLTQTERIVHNVCLRKGYIVNVPPGEDVTIVYNTFNHQNVLKVEEMDNTVTIDIKQSTIWEDRRIKTTFKKDNATIEMSSLSFLILYGSLGPL